MKAKTKIKTKSIVTLEMSRDEAEFLTTYLGNTTVNTTMKVLNCEHVHAEPYNDLLGEIYNILTDELRRET